MKALIGVNYFMGENGLPSIPMIWDCNHFLGNADIYNIFTRTRYQKVLQKFHIAENTKNDKTGKDYTTKSIIDLLHELFQAVFSNELDRSIDEKVIKLK